MYQNLKQFSNFLMILSYIHHYNLNLRDFKLSAKLKQYQYSEDLQQHFSTLSHISQNYHYRIKIGPIEDTQLQNFCCIRQHRSRSQFQINGPQPYAIQSQMLSISLGSSQCLRLCINLELQLLEEIECKSKCLYASLI